ncbi:MAG: hypothetical protein GY765_36165, partial [bacterium]|nr:hypothetical protein [bacterium]
MGIDFFRGFKWITPTTILEGDHGDQSIAPDLPNVKQGCICGNFCPACYPVEVFGLEGTAGLMWVGKKFYTVDEFLAESNDQGVSKRINTIPNKFEVGKHWIFLAHKEAMDVIEENGKDKLFDREPAKTPGIFMAIRPRRIERLVKESEYHHWEIVNRFVVKHESKPEDNFAGKHLEDYYKLKRDIDRG